MTQATLSRDIDTRRPPPAERSLGSLLRSLDVDTRLMGMILALAIIWIGFQVLSGGLFLTSRNLWNLSVQSSSIAVMATGMGSISVAVVSFTTVGPLICFS